MTRRQWMPILVQVLVVIMVVLTFLSGADFKEKFQPPDMGRTLSQDDDANSTTSTTNVQSTAPSPPLLSRPTMHVMYALCEDDPGFMLEFEISLKSVLLNAPHRQDLHVHVMTDSKAFHYLPQIWERTQIENSMWYTNVTITAYNVNQYMDGWADEIVEVTNGRRGKNTIHTFGTYFRLYMHKVLPKEVGYVLYMDTDVLALANLAPLMEAAPPNPSHETAPQFIMAQSAAGVMLVNNQKLDQFWQYMNITEWEEGTLGHYDQSMVQEIGKRFLGTLTYLPDPYDMTVTEHFGKVKNREKLLNFRPEAGLFHYNGGGLTKDAAYNNELWDRKVNGFGLPAIFYRELAWTWAKFMGKSAGAGLPNTTTIQIEMMNLSWKQEQELAEKLARRMKRKAKREQQQQQQNS